ncbi:Sodium/hydrogen exchanger-like protein 2 [Elsinoe fawcettii]|nr:Sodium/hydrogen exchanger-like protein 2 [Elsinoe fawcettii]
MPTLALVNFNLVCATLGGFITVFGLVSYLLKEKFYLSEALISLIAGVIFGPYAANWLRPEEYALHDPIVLETITLYFARLVLGVQLVLAGVQLPSRYLKLEWRSLSLLLGPAMCGMWICTSLLVWGLVPDLSFVYALAVGACVTPTDPVLSNTIVKGKFADKNIPRELQKIIVAESGANDGLGYPFLFLPLYLIKYYYGPDQSDGGAGKAIGLWFGETWGYVIIFSVVYGATVGWLAKELLHLAEERKYVDRESFLVFAIALALFIVGTCGLLGTDDVLACFVAGNAFTWDDWFRLETLDDSLQPTVDMLLNVAIFIWFGAVCPFPYLSHNPYIPLSRLLPLGLLVLLFRRLPVVLALHKHIHQIEGWRHALFVGFFGPVGVSAIFYLYIAREFLHDVTLPNGSQRDDAHHLAEVLTIVVWFLALCSIVVHGISIPLGKLGFYLPRTISAAISSDRASLATPPDPSTPSTPSSTLPSDANQGSAPGSAPRTPRSRTTASVEVIREQFRRTNTDLRFAPSWAGIVYRLKKSFLGERAVNPARAAGTGGGGNISGPSEGRVLGRAVPGLSSREEGEGVGVGGREQGQEDGGMDLDSIQGGDGGGQAGRGLGGRAMSSGQAEMETEGVLARRTIRFGDEAVGEGRG